MRHGVFGFLSYRMNGDGDCVSSEIETKVDSTDRPKSVKSERKRCFGSKSATPMVLVFLICWTIVSYRHIPSKAYDLYVNMDHRMRLLGAEMYETCVAHPDWGPIPRPLDECNRPVYPDDETKCLAQTRCYQKILDEMGEYVESLMQGRTPWEKSIARFGSWDPLADAKEAVETLKRIYATSICDDVASHPHLLGPAHPREALDDLKDLLVYANENGPKIFVTRLVSYDRKGPPTASSRE